MKPFEKSAMGLILSLVLLAVSVGAESPAAPKTSLKVLTINVWSGLDYVGTLKMGEYENAERRQARFATLLAQVKSLDPDIVFLQEANSAGGYAARLAGALGFRQIHQVVNGGIKFGPLGIPVNFKEGMAILARPALGLELHDVWKLSGPFGLYGDAITFHFSEAVFSLVGKITVGQTPFYLVDVHLASSPRAEEESLRKLRELPEAKSLTDEQFAQAVAEIEARAARRAGEVGRLLSFIKGLPADAPVLFAGDFNAEKDAPEIKKFLEETGAIDTFPAAPPTWNPQANENIAYSSRPAEASGQPRRGYALLDAMDTTLPKRIDFILLSKDFRPEEIVSSRVAIDERFGGLHASDHFGVFAEIDLRNVLQTAPKEPATVPRLRNRTIEVMPILMWDTDIGFGYGGKAFCLNPLGLSESFDLTVFNSTKGERWYRFVFSLPDFETRQGKIYPWAVDLSVDYDKMIKNNFFGLGAGSLFSDRETYARTPVEVNLNLSRGFTRRIVGQVGLKYARITNSGFAETGSRLETLAPVLNAGTARVFSLTGNLRYDSRDSYINPSRGIVLQGEAEAAAKTSWTDISFWRAGGWFQYYTVLFYPKTVFAFRLGGQNMKGEGVPVQYLLRLGGNSTLRGSPQDRYLDKAFVLVNAEIRFPMAGPLGGVVGLDAGKVWPSLADFDLRGWAFNPTVGLRFYLKTFLVRLDVGFGRDATGLYFNFGHIF
jgi:endonuclease/exonuclease/phosphatase family metal-dependent hydrolase